MPSSIPTFAAAGTLTREILGNHSSLSRGLFYTAATVSVVIFLHAGLRRVRLWRLGRPAQSPIAAGAALKHFTLDVLLQRRVFGRGWESAGHFLLFVGFMGLLLATTLLSVEHVLATLLGRAAGDPVFHKGIYYAIYEVLAECFGIALLIGCGILATRRWWRGPEMDHHWTDWAVLISLAILGVSGYVVEGLRIIYEQTPLPWFSFVGMMFAEAMRACGIETVRAATLQFCIWWLHAILALVFIAAFPYVRLFHSLAGTLRLVLAPSQLGQMSKLDVAEVEESGIIGASEIQHFTRRQLLELDACMSCGRCEAACPAFEAGKPLSPRRVVQDLRGYLDTVGPQLICGTASDGANLASGGKGRPAMNGDVISAATLWSCTTCSACVDVCPVGVDPLGLITDMRRYLTGEGQLRGAPASTLQNMERFGNPWGMPPQDRMAWAAGLNVPLAADQPDFELLYWVGCAGAYDRRTQKITRSVAQLLSAAKVRFAVLGCDERCNGESARRMGEELLFQQLAEKNIETLARHNVRRGAKRIVSHCPHCVNSLKQDYPQLGGDYEVLHHTELLAQLADAKRLPAPVSSLAGRGPLTYHDPCYLARVGRVTEPPRQLVQLALGSATNSPLVEMPRNRGNTSCCGAGGGRMWFDDGPAERVGTVRIQEVLDTGAKTVAVSCPFCLVMMTDGLAARGADVQVKDVAELMAESLVPKATT